MFYRRIVWTNFEIKFIFWLSFPSHAWCGSSTIQKHNYHSKLLHLLYIDPRCIIRFMNQNGIRCVRFIFRKYFRKVFVFKTYIMNLHFQLKLKGCKFKICTSHRTQRKKTTEILFFCENDKKIFWGIKDTQIFESKIESVF